MTSTSQPPQVTVFFQDKCLSHRYIRSDDIHRIFERPQRLRAVKRGVAAAIARLEEKNNHRGSPGPDEALSTALERLNISGEGAIDAQLEVIKLVMSTASVDILNHPAVRYVHGGVDGDFLPERLVRLVMESEEKVARGECEIPDDLNKSDLYLCVQSLDAIQGSIGTVCEAVETVLQASPMSVVSEEGSPSSSGEGSSRVFVAIRPPGHHCDEDTPAGFCFMNNVAIGVAHAHLKYSVTRVVILDIDLHHGNGTQSIAWQINERAHRQQKESDTTESSDQSSPLQIYYGSIHDALSYPCEDGDATFIQGASVSIHGPHGQHIENVHLLPYESDADFWDRLYPGPYARLLQTAEAFLKKDTTGKAMVFISAGFDASEHETTSMSRYGRRLPTSFYRRFTRDVRILADKYAKGRIVSVLEGGYSDRALCSGAMAHVLGLAEQNAEVDESWWSMENLIQIETATKKQRGGRSSIVPLDKWMERTLSLLSILDPNPSPPSTPRAKPVIPPSTMVLRDRSKKPSPTTPNTSVSGTPPPKSPSPSGAGKDGEISKAESLATADERQVSAEQTAEHVEGVPVKKLPRVILKVNPPATSG